MKKLKTLNDLKKEWKKSIINENDLQNNPIEFSYTGELIPLEIVEGDLRDEAIKGYKNSLYQALQFEDKGDLATKEFCLGMCSVYNEFFSLTEEDLK